MLISWLWVLFSIFEFPFSVSGISWFQGLHFSCAKYQPATILSSDRVTAQLMVAWCKRKVSNGGNAHNGVSACTLLLHCINTKSGQIGSDVVLRSVFPHSPRQLLPVWGRLERARRKEFFLDFCPFGCYIEVSLQREPLSLVQRG